MDNEKDQQPLTVALRVAEALESIAALLALGALGVLFLGSLWPRIAAMALAVAAAAALGAAYGRAVDSRARENAKPKPQPAPVVNTEFLRKTAEEKYYLVTDEKLLGLTMRGLARDARITLRKVRDRSKTGKQLMKHMDRRLGRARTDEELPRVLPYLEIEAPEKRSRRSRAETRRAAYRVTASDEKPHGA